MAIATPEVYAEMIDRAKAGKFAYPAVNITSSQTVTAAIQGFAEAESDGIIQVSVGGAEYASGSTIKDRIAGSLGEKIPLETERGYNTTLPAGAFDLRTQVTFGGHGFVVTRLTSGIRVGGAVELGGLELPANFARSEALLRKAQAFLPGLKAEGGKQWMGFRPSLPDSLPAIGRARHSARVVYAFGHGHLGLTQSVGTARLVADLLTGQKSPIDLGAFSPQRF